MITLQTQAQPITAPAPQLAPPAAAPQAPAAATDSVSVSSHHKDIDEKNFSWLDLGKGVSGSVVGGAIEGVGGLAAGITKSPRITYEAVKGVWHSKMLGPVLKSTVTPVILAAGLLTPILTTLGGVGYGMFEGFKEGAEKNPVAAGKAAVETCKKMNGQITKGVVEGIRDAAAHEPASPEEVYEIKVVDAGKGLVSSVAAAAIDGAGAGLTTAAHLPQAYAKISKELWKSDAALPLKVGGQFLATAAAVLAVPLATVGGCLYGLGMGAVHGYQHGMVDATQSAAKDLGRYNDALNNLVKN